MYLSTIKQTHMGRTKEQVDLPFVVGCYGSYEDFVAANIQGREYYYPSGKVEREDFNSAPPTGRDARTF